MYIGTRLLQFECKDSWAMRQKIEEVYFRDVPCHTPLLFKLYSEEIFLEAIFEATKGIINDESIENIRYADDILNLTNNGEDLQIVNLWEIWSYDDNIKKTKYKSNRKHKIIR